MRYREPDKRQQNDDGAVTDYNPPEYTDEILDVRNRPGYISDNTAFMHWSTELEHTPNVIEPDFLKRNRQRVGDINKFLALSNIKSPRSLKLFHLRRMCITLATEADLIDIGDETMLDNIADYQTSRGIEGFYQKALITQRRELREESRTQEKKSFWRNLFRSREEEETAGFDMEE